MDNSKYVDNVTVAMSPLDIKLVFAVTEPILADNGEVAGSSRDEMSRITLSLPLAKKLTKLLADAINNYETSFGSVVDIDTIGNNVGKDA